MKKIIIIISIVFILIVGIIISILLLRKDDDEVDVIDGGVVKDGRLKGYEEKIKSKNIVSFEYKGRCYVFSAKINGDKLHIISKGTLSNNRDNSNFLLDYEIDDFKFFTNLQNIIDEYKISKNNGYEYEVGGLPPDLGDSILVEYESKEKIWKYSNQSPMVDDNAFDAIYNLFLELAKKNNLDFTTDKSTVDIYDDATIEYVQGTWEGTHFGNNYRVEFNGNNIKIYKNDVLTDDTEFTIVEGNIVPNELKDGIANPESKNDYKEFSDISFLKKKNDFTTDKSTVDIYDDATIEYVQGIWEGTHFGNNYRVEFNGNNIKIYKNDVLTDDTEFTIVEGNIVPNELKDGIANPESKNDYKEFSDISLIKKKNDFTMTMYFMKESYSTDDLLKQR